jgi:N-acetylglucosamine-6-phosphate deacetylase
MTVTVKGRLLLPDGVLARGTLVLDGSLIAEVRADEVLDPRRVYDEGQTLVPGFVDLQLNGAFGCDFQSRPETVAGVAARLPRFGTTAFLPTLISAPVESYAPRAATIAAAREEQPTAGAAILGVHLEGPFLNPEKRGAHNPAYLHAPREEEFEAYLGCRDVRLVTLAPELPGADRLIAAALAQGIVVSAGHSAATYEEAQAAFAAGVAKGTHIFSAMPAIHHREPGLAVAVLTAPHVRAGLIADGVHAHPAMVDLVYRAKGTAGIILVTDAMAGLGQPPGTYELGDRTVIVDGTSARLSGGSLAGSILSMDAAVRNMVEFTHGACSPASALQMASAVPADALGLGHTLGRLRRGYTADVVALGPDLTVCATWTRGTLAYER